MSATEIILLLLGITVFIISFVIPEQKSKATETDRRLSEELVRESIEQEVNGAKTQIQDMVEDTVSYSIEKTERTLERLTNEKMQAVNDYSDTVLSEINKNHKEVLFLYDMLNDKQQDIQETVKNVDRVTRTMHDTVNEAGESVNDITLISDKELATESKEEKTVPEKKTAARKASAKGMEKSGKQEKSGEDFKPLTGEKVVLDKMMNDIDFIVGGENTKNNNEKILELHKSGRSKMAIAKELGLGIGEVKLVIDLFEGI